MLPLSERESPDPIAGDEDFVSNGLQDELHELCERWVVVNHQDPSHYRRCRLVTVRT